ncbi:hypothetical protein LI177_00460 [bacterium 210820-DFI.6.37]|nr:hypothetical protein [bacterium 210820-DFI.6.37]
MDTLDFFIQKADCLEVECYTTGYISIDIILERDTYGRTLRAIALSKDEKDLVEVSCYEDWGGDGHGSASILDDELRALIEFVPDFKVSQDRISQILSFLLKIANNSFKMVISSAGVEIKWETGFSCSISRNQELHCKNILPKELEKEIPRITFLLWGLE